MIDWDERYKLLTEEYERFQNSRKIAYDQSKYVFENVDKWLLTLSSGGVALTTASLAINDQAKANSLIALAGVSFLLAIGLALVTKGISYLATKWYVKATDTAWVRFQHRFSRAHRRYTIRGLRRVDVKISILNITTYVAFLLGLLLIAVALVGQVARIGGQGDATSDAAAKSTLSPDASTQTGSATSP